MERPSAPERSPEQITARILNPFSRWLLEPTRKITDPAKRQKARLLALFLLCMFVIFLGINLGYTLTLPEYRLPPADLVGYVVLLGTYLLSRSRLTSIAVLIMLLMFPMNVFSNIIGGTSANTVATLAFLLPGFILASIFLNRLELVVYGGLTCVGVALLPLLAPGQVSNLQEVIGPLSVGVLAIALLVIANTHRDNIERTRQAEIRAAYDKTLEGWSRALEIRDKEIKGHATRVTDLTMELARAFGFRGEKLEQIFRGALLHDIGKMSIPDSILFKPAALDEEEWAIMKTHPTIAVELLSGISFLEPALVIAACHHEWWDGSGYPRGLRGEEIPLEARIFAVVDVLDALLSERPYRHAWTKEAALRYLQEQRSKQFDPQVVDRFLEILQKSGGRGGELFLVNQAGL